MPLNTQIIDFCRLSDSECRFLGEKSGHVVSGVKASLDSTPTDITWVSNSFMQNSPSLLYEIEAAILLMPLVEEFELKRIKAKSVIQTRYPKRIFSLCVHNFFSELTDPGLPHAMEPAISEHAKIEKNVFLGHGTVVGHDVSIGDNCWIGPNCVLANTSIGSNVKIGANCSIGLNGFGYERDSSGNYFIFPHISRVVIEDCVEIGSNTCIDRGALTETKIKKHCKIDNLVHIAHNVSIGENSLIIANAMIGGSTIIEGNVWVAPSSSIINNVRIKQNSTVGLGAVVIRDSDEGQVLVGNPAKPLSKKK